jgi:hypothetical protein
MGDRYHRGNAVKAVPVLPKRNTPHCVPKRDMPKMHLSFASASLSRLRTGAFVYGCGVHAGPSCGTRALPAVVAGASLPFL